MVVVISVLHPENKDVYIGMLYTNYRHPAQPVNPSASCLTCLIPIRLAPIRSQETPIHPVIKPQTFKGIDQDSQNTCRCFCRHGED